MALLFGFVRYAAALHHSTPWLNAILGLIIALLLAPFGGYLFGACLWSYWETKYIETKELHGIIRSAARGEDQ
jgi:hypothetical protein